MSKSSTKSTNPANPINDKDTRFTSEEMALLDFVVEAGINWYKEQGFNDVHELTDLHAKIQARRFVQMFDPTVI